MAASQERLRELARDHNTAPVQLRRRGKVLVVDGFGVSLRVEHGRLVVSDGAGRGRREHSFGRAGTSIARVVVLGGTGSLALAALRWLADQGVPLLALDQGEPTALRICASGKRRRSLAQSAGACRY